MRAASRKARSRRSIAAINLGDDLRSSRSIPRPTRLLRSMHSGRSTTGAGSQPPRGSAPATGMPATCSAPLRSSLSSPRTMRRNGRSGFWSRATSALTPSCSSPTRARRPASTT
jgi:hypothetical protein